MKIRTMVVTLALSFTAAVFCSGAEVTTPTEATPAKAAAAKAKPAAAAKKEMPAKKEMAPMMAAPMSPQMGTWKLNEAKSKLAPGMGKNMTVVYSAMKDGMKVTAEGVDKDGKPTRSVWMGKFDGKSYVVKGDKMSDSRGYTMVNDHTLNMTVRKGGKVTAMGKIVVAKNGKSRVVTINWTGADGKKLKSKAVYDKA